MKFICHQSWSNYVYMHFHYVQLYYASDQVTTYHTKINIESWHNSLPKLGLCNYVAIVYRQLPTTINTELWKYSLNLKYVYT